MINTTQNIATKHHLEHNLEANISCFQINYYDKEGVWQQTRHIGWTEDNRITNIIDKSYHSYYSYDDGGERTLKLTGVSNIIDVNAEFLTYQSTLKNITLYTSPYLVAHNKGYTKHFYAGSERVCAAIGEGGLNSLEPCIGQNSSLQTTSTNLFNNTMGTMHDRYLLDNTDCLNNGEDVDKGLKIELEEVVTRVVINPSVDGSTFLSTLNKYCSQNKANSAVYYYHSDHLGSASWITNKTGTPVQHLQYMPYGEPLVNERTGLYEERFTFTGKERDSETGFSYFGARYYDSDLMTGWLSVDPMADKYPSHSPYQYCRWNPIKRIDIGGLFDTEKQAQKAYEKAVKRFGSDRVGEIYNRGTERNPDYSFAVYGVGKDNKTHAKQGEAGVWAYRPDCIISDRKSLRSYSWNQRKFGFSVSFSVGAQVGSGISLGKNWGCTANLSSVDLFSHASEYSKVKGWEHNTYTIDNSDIHGNAGVGISAYGYEVGYNCSYTACGEAINQDSMVHSVNIGYAESSSNGRISLGIGAAIIFGVKIELYSEYAK